jgi:hypothetical protein
MSGNQAARKNGAEMNKQAIPDAISRANLPMTCLASLVIGHFYIALMLQ